MSKIQLKNVRLSFPSVFQKATFNGQEGKYEATFLIDKSDTETKAKLDEVIASALAEAKIKVPSDKMCLKDGDNIDYDGYENVWSFKGSSAKRPTVINRDKTPITEEDGILYAGCYVNAVVDIWVQKNDYGKRVNGNLYAIQFVKDGPAFGGDQGDVLEEFEDLDDI